MRGEESYHGDVASFDWLADAESLEQSAPLAGAGKCGPCFPVQKRKEERGVYYLRKHQRVQKPRNGGGDEGSRESVLWKKDAKRKEKEDKIKRQIPPPALEDG